MAFQTGATLLSDSMQTHFFPLSHRRRAWPHNETPLFASLQRGPQLLPASANYGTIPNGRHGSGPSRAGSVSFEFVSSQAKHSSGLVLAIGNGSHTELLGWGREGAAWSLPLPSASLSGSIRQLTCANSLSKQAAKGFIICLVNQINITC